MLNVDQTFLLELLKSLSEKSWPVDFDVLIVDCILSKHG